VSLPCKIHFPANTGQRYYSVHYQYVLNMLRAAGCDVEIMTLPSPDDLSLIVDMDGRKLVFDYADHSGIRLDMPHFKFHCREMGTPAIPFAPVSFHDWHVYEEMLCTMNYRAEGEVILNNQNSRDNVLVRRTHVQAMLLERYGGSVDTEITDQPTWWRKLGQCLVYVHVPGWCNNMLDRGQLQAMAFGVCTISPYLPEYLPGWRRIEAGVHYVQCRDDYSDLIETIEYCKEDRSHCRMIGNNAARLFRECCTPQRLRDWIEESVSQ